MNRSFQIAFLFLVSFSAGYYFFKGEQPEYQNLRYPAAVQSSYDLSHLSGDKLLHAVKGRILAGLQIEKQSENTVINLGHFAFTNEQGHRVYGCEAFKDISLVFEAEGVSVAGAKPEMELKAACQASSDMTKISSLYVPVFAILNETPTDSDFSFKERGDMSIRFVNLADEWPRLWLLKKVSLQGVANTQPVVIESDEVSQTLGHPVVLKF